MTIGGSGMYSVTVVLPQIQAEFGIDRADASLPYTLTMVGFGLGGVAMGKLADRFGVMWPVLVGSIGLALGFVAAGHAQSLWQFGLAQGLLMGFLGTASTFAPLVADTSQWFTRRRGIAVAICMSGNYVAGAVWPPVMQHFIDTVGWRATYQGVGLSCLATMLPLALMLRARPPTLAAPVAVAVPVPVPVPVLVPVPVPGLGASVAERPLGLAPATLQGLLCVAGVACCVAMSMPQVHIVAYCGDLGFGAARGAQMLALMLGLGVVSRLVSGWISDHIGGLRTLLLGSVLQGVALLLFFFNDALLSLYVISALFGLFQGGIVPSYALIVRENFSPKEAGARVGTVLMATLFGMALGGWMSGAVFDATGSYRAAFANGIAWNLLNVSIVVFLLLRSRGIGRRLGRTGGPGRESMA
ncbi:MAG: MFS transporter [Burkholderiaceae bacterium]